MMIQKISSTLASLVFFIGLMSATFPESKVTVNIDSSRVEWKAFKVTGSHEGNIKIKEGTLHIEGDRLLGGELIIDMSTINTTDLKGGRKENLDDHLKSEDFFNVKVHPTATLLIKQVYPKGTPGDFKVIADITIKGITEEIKFYTHLKKELGKYKASANLDLDRTDFQIRYGSGSFFDNLGDKTIYDEFNLRVDIVTN